MALLPLLGLLLPLLLAVDLLPTTAQPLSQSCSRDTNYTANSAFSTNLNRLLSSLPANGSATGFFDNIVGSDVADWVYGLVLCRGDVSAGDCRSCLDTAAEDIQLACPYRKSAIIWYDYCMLRYSDRQSLSNPDDSPKLYMWNTYNLTEVDVFNRQLSILMLALVHRAAFNESARMFATGQADYVVDETPTIYGLVQCTRDQSANQCSACLGGIVAEMPFVWSRGVRVLMAACNYRYETYSFYNSSAMVSVPLSTKPAAALQPAPATSPVARNSPTDSPPAPGKKNRNSTDSVLAIAIPLGGVSTLISVICICFCRRKDEESLSYRLVLTCLHFSWLPDVRDTDGISTIESLLFDPSTLRAATGNFSELNLLGQGGFGSVYKGLLPSGQVVAVKRLLAGCGQGVEQLKNEVVLLAKLQHRKLVKLLGVCLDGEDKLLIVYEYVPNRSLDKFLFDPAASHQLNWERRFKIIVGIALGLQYLHEDSQVKIIHRDLKASNVLLDGDMNPKISDFGLARLFPGDQTQASTTRVVGTFGYMAPEYVMRGQFSSKSDVFSFGVLVLEIVTGQRNTSLTTSGSPADLLGRAWEHWRNGTIQEIVDPSLSGQCQGSDLMRCVQIGLLCVQEAAADRPTMSSVVLMLSSESMSMRIPSRPAFFFGHSQPAADAGWLSGNSNISALVRPEESSSRTLLVSLNEVSVSELEPR
ncbi:hypothetical protein Taro_051874 [Colocasia esculenta]|uniref:Cysteine-rich receptor-like protein kinase 10 n=1 Tax=Colocasia esculenta TaxID=4460 RepID=A0A843XH62_COLES|nr:hypothetical protein [Colocasia esculenta]